MKNTSSACPVQLRVRGLDRDVGGLMDYEDHAQSFAGEIWVGSFVRQLKRNYHILSELPRFRRILGSV